MKRNKVIKVRCTLKEWNQFRGLAKLYKGSVSQMVRQWVLEGDFRKFLNEKEKARVKR